MYMYMCIIMIHVHMYMELACMYIRSMYHKNGCTKVMTDYCGRK